MNYIDKSFIYSEKKKREEGLRLARKIRRKHRELLKEGYQIDTDSLAFKGVSIAYDVRNAKKVSIKDIRTMAAIDTAAVDRGYYKTKSAPVKYDGPAQKIDIVGGKVVKAGLAEKGEFVTDVHGYPKQKTWKVTRADEKAIAAGKKTEKEKRRESIEKERERREKIKRKKEKKKRKPKPFGVDVVDKGQKAGGSTVDIPTGGGSAGDTGLGLAPEDSKNMIIVEQYLAMTISDLMNRGASDVWQGIVEQLEQAIHNVIDELGDEGYNLIAKLIEDGTLPQSGTYMDSDGILDCIDAIGAAVNDWMSEQMEKGVDFDVDKLNALDNLKKGLSDLSEYQAEDRFVNDYMNAAGAYDLD